MKPRGLAVIAMGNPDRGDDGVALRIAELLEEARRQGKLGSAVQIIAAGTDGVLAAACISEGEQVLLVDAASMGLPPGSWRVFSPREVLSRRHPGGWSTHTLSAAGVLELAEALGCDGNLRVLGIQVGDAGPGSSLTPEVRACVPHVVRRIREEAEALS